MCFLLELTDLMLQSLWIPRTKLCDSSRPAYAAELTALESEIEQLWDQYVLRYRCVEALKHQLSVLESAQAEVRSTDA